MFFYSNYHVKENNLERGFKLTVEKYYTNIFLNEKTIFS